jgi:hypothetical protein
VYLVINKEAGLLQIGITGDLPTRFSDHERNGFSPIDTIRYASGIEAQELERDIKLMLKDVLPGRRPSRIGGKKFDGWTESWYINDLGVSTITELRDLLPVFA